MTKGAFSASNIYLIYDDSSVFYTVYVYNYITGSFIAHMYFTVTSSRQAAEHLMHKYSNESSKEVSCINIDIISQPQARLIT